MYYYFIVPVVKKINELTSTNKCSLFEDDTSGNPSLVSDNKYNYSKYTKYSLLQLVIM